MNWGSSTGVIDLPVDPRRLLDTALNSIFVPETSLGGDEDFEIIKCSYCRSVTAFPKDFSERDSSSLRD